MAGNLVLSVSTDTRAYMSLMKKISKKEFPQSVAATLNRVADGVTDAQIKNVKKDLIVRKPYTIKSMQYRGRSLYHATGKKVSRMFTRAGTRSNYLWLQENSIKVSGPDGASVAIPTLSARTSRSQRKSIARMYAMDRIMDQNVFIGRPKGSNRPPGIWLRKTKKRASFLVKLRDLSHPTVQIRGVGFHRRAVERKGTESALRGAYREEFFKRIGLG